jgi:uncharacterized integral membrane protein (TIGR00697 family)
MVSVMTTDASKQSSAEYLVSPKVLWVLILVFSIVQVHANWFTPRLVDFFGIITTAGILIFPLKFLLCNVITEVYGFKNARMAVWCALLTNWVSILYGQLVLLLPNPHFATQNTIYETILFINVRVVMASCVTYLLTETLNAYLISTLKIKMTGHNMGARFVLTTLFVGGLDSLIFGMLAFYGRVQISHLVSLILSMWFMKVVIEIGCLPMTVRFVKKLKKYEMLDIYDRKTSFNIFKLETRYLPSENEYAVKSN